ncbi:uncharacterized protein LOC143226064 [Tachypleus tridentatus]|uniref:uncharacterized protein LOC143226064 n=1 Tax=Tachypleus tridentatus TaxID=6853 RepID=UPI003FD0B061
MDTIKKSLRKSSSEAFSIKDINQIETGFSDNLIRCNFERFKTATLKPTKTNRALKQLGA